MNSRTAPHGFRLFSLVFLLAVVVPVSTWSEGRNTRVVVVESAPEPEGYHLIISGKRYRATLDAVATGSSPGDQLAIVLASDVPVEAIPTLASMASKCGNFGPTLKIFVLDPERDGMVEVSVNKDWFTFSTDPQQMAQRFDGK
jgi:hypothetical protein